MLKVFRKVKKITSAEDRARKRAVSIEEYQRIFAVALPHLRPMLQIAMYTGCGTGRSATCNGPTSTARRAMIRLTPDITKNKRSRMIPLTQPIKDVLDSLPRHLHGYVVSYGGKRPAHQLGAKTGAKGRLQSGRNPIRQEDG